jgi:hypothetical protein
MSLQPVYDADVEVLREQIAPDATDAELRHFARVCGALDLSPFAGQICLIGRYDRRKKTKVHRPQITVAGRRARAERTGQLAGIDGPEWCGPRLYDNRGQKLPLDWVDLWDDDDQFPYAARCLVWRHGWAKPANGTAKWAEFAVWERSGDQEHLGLFWKRMPSHMLGKVAESLALRRAFPDDAAYRLASGGGGTFDDNAVFAELEAERHNQALPTSGVDDLGTVPHEGGSPVKESGPARGGEGVGIVGEVDTDAEPPPPWGYYDPDDDDDPGRPY